MKKNLRKWLFRALVIVVLALLLWWAIQKIPLQEILAAITRLRWWQILVILAVNFFIFICVTLRWWIIVKAEAKQVPFFQLLPVRVAVFGISYFTFGPQVGGEPLQVFSLERKYGVPFTRAVASVIMDKLLEFLIDFVLLAVGVTSLLRAGLLTESTSQRVISWVVMGLLVLVPPLHLTLLHARKHPITAMLRRVPFVPHDWKPLRFLRASEWMAGTFVRRHPRALAGSLAASFGQAVLMLVDYSLIISFLGLRLPFWNDIAGWAAGWLAFLIPLPGGLGALEASQVFALGRFGITPAVALGVALVMRGRDVFIGGLGLLMAGRGWRKKKPAPLLASEPK